MLTFDEFYIAFRSLRCCLICNLSLRKLQLIVLPM